MSEKPPFRTRVFDWAGGYVGCAVYLGLALGSVIGFGFGLFYAERQAYMRQWHEERELLEPIVASDPAFTDVRLAIRSNGGYNLIGMVPKQADRNRLRERVIRGVGEKRADEIVLGVSTRR